MVCDTVCDRRTDRQKCYAPMWAVATCLKKVEHKSKVYALFQRKLAS